MIAGKRMMLMCKCETHFGQNVLHHFFLHSSPNYRKEILTWSLEVPQLRGSVIDLKDPVTSSSFSPAMNGHELPVFKSFHGMIKKPKRET